AMRTRAVAQAIVAYGGQPHVVVDDAATAEVLASSGLDVALEVKDRAWTARPACGAWVDVRGDCTLELARLHASGTTIILVENRTLARDHANVVVYPSLHHVDDTWDLLHPERVVSGAGWIPLAREVVDTRPAQTRDIELLVTFGGADPNQLTERVL